MTIHFQVVLQLLSYPANHIGGLQGPTAATHVETAVLRMCPVFPPDS